MRYFYKSSSFLLALAMLPMALPARYAARSGVLPIAVNLAGNQTDRERLQQLKRAIDEEIGEPRADSIAECKYIPFGSKRCGGPWTFLVYSTARTDEPKLKRLVSDFNALQKKINEEEQIGSDCSVPQPPELVLENGVCAAKRR
jgi:hypothetical protein